MSADLFAEFGSAPTQQRQQATNSHTPATQAAPAFSFFDDFASTAPVQPQQEPQQEPQAFQWPESKAVQVEENDDWGDFEGGSSAAPVVVTHDPFTSTQTFQAPHDNWQPAQVIKAKKSADSSVLFDAEDAGDDDDFGDFEDGDDGFNVVSAPPPIQPVQSSSGLADLLGDMAVSQPAQPTSIQKGHPKRSSNRTLSNVSKGNQESGFGAMSKGKQQQPPASPRKPVATTKDDSWDSFDDWEATIPTKAPTKVVQKPKNSPTNPAAIPQFGISSNVDEPQPGEMPPTNVPPPAVLLSLFPALFSDAQEKLFKPMASQTLPMRNKLLSEPGTVIYLQAYLTLSCVAARIIAGRKLRWKRDAHLSQGMRIGPASSRATSGMKLTGIDKSENMKEEREVSDVVRAWKEQVGRLRHVVSAVNQSKEGSLGAVPDIQETMPTRTLKQAEGGIPSPQPCMLCGLKRDERVTTADHGVEDSFGEWWIDQASMHRGCRNFWHQHKDALRQR
ncbi:hypothetical protein B0J11DRAFT_177105 [Dendryphion nanum]|uniref:Serine/threonine-protein kinase ppk6 n=1 Tax=Dendryphion nanum TaxID=256645 RepID=A0A9P9IYW1_9PLEO|nr:hypothetical protein B0J11DRAFT_177105 [Dendryphion nanum]